MSAWSFALAALLLGTPLATLAQASDPAPAHRFYGGVALYTGAAQAFGDFDYGRFNVPVQGTLGYQVRPRLAVQVGLAYSGTKGDDSYAHDYTSPNGGLTSYLNTTSYVRRAYSTSVLARYTLTRQATHRFQVDLLGGPSFDHSTSHFANTESAIGQGLISVSAYEYSYDYNNLLVNLGPSFRYHFGEHIEAVYDILFNVSLTNNHNVNTAMALGLRYRFGGG